MSMRRFLTHEAATIRGVAHELEYDPTTQWVYHRKMTWFWFVMFIPVIVMGLASTMGVWLSPLMWANVLLIFNLVMSCYANFATEFDAVAAADAARKAGGAS